MEQSYPHAVPCPTAADPHKVCTEHGSWFSIPFFITFISVTSYIMLNAIVTAVVNAFNENMVDSDKLAPMDDFLQRWCPTAHPTCLATRRPQPTTGLFHHRWPQASF